MFTYLIYGAILALGSGSYIFALRNIIHGHYRPNLFSRTIWFLLAVNSFAGVLVTKSSSGSVVLSLILLLGSLSILVASIPRGRREFGKLELICSVLLVVSLLIWIFFKTPFINLGIGLFAHFLGALPTYKEVIINPKVESKTFWLLFFGASFLSILANYNLPIQKLIVPIYFTLFDGSMFALSLRKKA